jgi:hypothetical protein
MKKIICFFIGFALFCCSQLMAQKYTAANYWKMERDSVYTGLTQRQKSGESLSVQEQSFLVEYKTKLAEYFENMSDDEKSLYYKNRTKWAEQPPTVDKISGQQDSEVFSGEKSTYTKYIFSSGMFGFVYGTAIVTVLGGWHGGGAVGIPLLAAGTSTLIPILTIKDKKVTYNSLKLSLHGKTMGLLHGAALGLLISGENVNQNEKLFLGLATLSSVALGRVGYNLGRDKSWSKGRVALYSHYGLLMPFEGLALDAALKIEDPRIYAATFLAFGAGGYLIADRIAQWNDFTVGDITSTQTLAALNAMLGLGILIDITANSETGPGILMIPAAGALTGTIAGHFWLKDARLSNQQGRNTALATAGGAAIGLGLIAILGFESITPYYILPYLTGMSTYALLVNKYKKDNQLAFFKPEKDSRWVVNLMPQNILLNREIINAANTRPGKQPVFLPAFSATLHF